jgi:hypothetical protein
VLTGTGTSGAYHAGVLQALNEAGVRVDLVAARGIGALGAMFFAVDGGSRLWDADGFWRSEGVRGLYGWTPRLKVAGWALAVAAACLLLPVAILIGVGLMYLAGWVIALGGATTASATVNNAAGGLLGALFDPSALPTIVPRLAVLAGTVALVTLAVAGWSARRGGLARHESVGSATLFGAPLDRGSTISRAAASLWELLRGAAPLVSPGADEISRKYSETLAENLGQPGFRELLILAHDLDARRDVMFALLAGQYRARIFGRKGVPGRSGADAIDLAGTGRDHALDALGSALSVPLATAPHLVRFAAESYWRGETHRIADRPSAIGRLLEEVAACGAEQVILVSGAPALEGPHALAPARGDARGHGGEVVAAIESAALRDAQSWASGLRLFPGGLFVIRPPHNPVGPLDFSGSYDPRSDRDHPVSELIDRGYEDAYRQFIDPVVAVEAVDKTV